MGGGDWIEFPCDWVKGFEKVSEKASSDRNLLYLFFHSPTPRLEGNFHASPEMQRISKEVLVFVDMAVESKKPTGQLRDLLKRCQVSKLPSAAITDQYGNLLYARASTTDSKKLEAQVKVAKKTAEKIAALLQSTQEKARDYCKEKKYSLAAQTLSKAKKLGYVGLPQVAEIDKLYSQINLYFEKLLKKISEANVSEAKKRDALQSLKSQAYRDLPVSEKIATALRELS